MLNYAKGYRYFIEQTQTKTITMITGKESAMPLALGGQTMNGMDDYITDGLTIRQHFAAMAMQGLLAGYAASSYLPNTCAEASVQFADALIEELNKIEQKGFVKINELQ